MSQNGRNTIKYMVAIVIPEPSYSQLSDIQDRLRPPNWRITIGPHITLLPPDRPLVDPDEAARRFAALVIPTRAFVSTASRILKFDRGSKHTLALEPSPRSKIKSLRRRLEKNCDWQQVSQPSKHPYAPHITLVNQIDDAGLRHAQEQLQSMALSSEFYCQRVALYCKEASWPKWKLLTQKMLNL
jgi:2'-5' RNA ligase